MFCGLLGHVFIYLKKKRAKYSEIFLKMNAFSLLRRVKHVAAGINGKRVPSNLNDRYSRAENTDDNFNFQNIYSHLTLIWQCDWHFSALYEVAKCKSQLTRDSYCKKNRTRGINTDFPSWHSLPFLVKLPFTHITLSSGRKLPSLEIYPSALKTAAMFIYLFFLDFPMTLDFF